jgi:hypothetical protein
MNTLSLELFTHPGRDVEAAQYRILAAVKELEHSFRHSKLYPGLSTLLETGAMLEAIRQNAAALNERSSQTLSGVDLDRKVLLFDDTRKPQDGEVERMLDLINWSLPLLKPLADEGMAVYDFVAQSMSIDTVGIMPMYRDEGYLLVPDLKSDVVHIFRFELALFTREDDKYRAMKTVELPVRPQRQVLEAPENVKLELVAAYSDLPNPATFLCGTDIDFPFDATVLPVAKRKLMRYLAS